MLPQHKQQATKIKQRKFLTRKMRMRVRSKRPATSSTSTSSGDEVEEQIVIKKGPWKAEEDEVLLKHVNKYGPRDWSSLLSKDLLRRTGKSCRLRWVNKLRPNLKNGCKFSADEERIVIELQSQLGNKWAKIATYLPGRTDNDVKNFWSSRQKRLARLLLNSQQENVKSKSNKNPSNVVSVTSQDPNREAESSNSVDYTTGALDVVPMNMSSNIQPISSIPFEFQNLPFLEPPSDLQLLSPNTQEELIGNLDLDFMGAFEATDNPVRSEPIVVHDDDQKLMQLTSEMENYLVPLEATDFSDQQLGGEMNAGGNDVLDQNPFTPDRFFDDLPADIFDHMEPFPSPPSDW